MKGFAILRSIELLVGTTEMMLSEVTVKGTLQGDGTLQLDEKPELAPGRVSVTLRPERGEAEPASDWWDYMQQARRQLEAAGAHFMNEEQVAAHIRSLREPDRTDQLLQGDQ